MMEGGLSNGAADKRRKIVLIGGGGHCKSVLDTLTALGTYSEIFVTDKEAVTDLQFPGVKFAGSDDALPGLFRDGVREAFLSIGSITSSKIRQQARGRARDIGFDFPSIIDPSARISSTADIGKGVFIGKGAIVNAGVRIGDFAIINTGSIIEHDCRVGEFTHVAVGAVVCGKADMGSDVFVGANATVIQGVKVGRKSVIGAGSVVLRDVPENGRAVGVWEG